MNNLATLAVIDGGDWKSDFGRCLLSLSLFEQSTGGNLNPNQPLIMKRSSAGAIADSRNEVVRAFLETDSRWLFMLDADMAFRPELLDGLIKSAMDSRIPVLGALTFALRVVGSTRAGCPSYDVIPTIYDVVEIEETGKVGFLPRLGYADSGERVQECSATGAACLLVHRKVLERLNKPGEEQGPFQRLVLPGRNGSGGPEIFSEDLSFCTRARIAGFKVGVDTGIEVEHCKGGVTLRSELRLKPGVGSHVDHAS